MCRYICREWNKRHTGGEVLMAHKTWIMTQQARPLLQHYVRCLFVIILISRLQVRLDWTRGPWIKELQHDHVCF
jgi:hypothetical protein